MHHWLKGIGLLPVLALLAGPAASAADRPDLMVGVNSLGGSLDPADTGLATELRINGSIFDTLIKRDFKAEAQNLSGGAVLVPSLATSWTRLDDRTLELKLRQGVKFQNGDPFTAEDVAFTFSPERIFGPEPILPLARKYFGCFEPIKVVDDHTIQIRSCSADPILENKLTHYSAGIVDRRAYTQLGQNGFKRAPVGTGPLKFVSWHDGDAIKFVANDEYFGGVPSFKSVTFREVPEVATRLSGLIGGEFDLITQIGPDQFPAIASNGNLEVRPSLLEQTQMVWMVATNPAVSDKRIRQALAMSIDRDMLASALWEGRTIADAQFQVPTLGRLFFQERRGFPFDPDRARKLLAEAGYNGAPVTIRVLANYYINGEAVAQAVQAMWQSVGVNAKLEIVENWSQAFKEGAAAVMGGCGFELAAPESLGSCFFGKQALTRQRGFPNGIPGMDDLAAQLSTLDAGKRAQAFGSILDVLEDQVPAIPLYRTPQFFAAKKTVRWNAYPDWRMDLRPDNLAFGK